MHVSIFNIYEYYVRVLMYKDAKAKRRGNRLPATCAKKKTIKGQHWW